MLRRRSEDIVSAAPWRGNQRGPKAQASMVQAPQEACHDGELEHNWKLERLTFAS